MTFFEGYIFKNGRTVIITDEGEEVDFCPEIKITEVVTSIKDGTQRVKIQIYGYEAFSIDREALVGDLLLQLVKRGLSVPKVKEYEVTLSEILFDTEKQATKVYSHEQVGFHKFKGKQYFWGNGVCTAKFMSKYEGALHLTSKGTFDSWREKILPLVKSFPATVIAMAMGASAPIVYLLKRASVIEESPIYSIIGRSSVGKTTMLKLSASVCGKPSFNGVMTTFTGSEAGFFTSLSNRLGFPFFVDDSSTNSKMDLTRLIYEISMCQEGNKCMGDGTLRPSKKWLTSVTFTGEKSLLTDTNKNSGLYARVAEFDIQWFEGEGVSEAICKHITQNYGTAYSVLIDTLKKYKCDSLATAFDKRCDELELKTEAMSSIGKRLLKKYALLLLTIDIMVEAWKIEVDRNRVVELLLTAFNQCLPDTDAIDKFYEDFLVYISSHSNSFPQQSKRGEMFPSPKLGVQDKYKYRPCVWITVPTFETLLQSSGLGCSDGILHEMKDKGMIEYFSDRFRKRHSIGDIKLLCFCVYLDGDDHKKRIEKNSKKMGDNKAQKKNKR